MKLPFPRGAVRAGMAGALVVGVLAFSAALAEAAAGSPNPGSMTNQLNAVSVDSSSDAWAVGAFNGTGGNDLTLALHWTGAKWVHVASPSPDATHSNVLNGVDSVSSSDVWAVGSYLNSSPTVSAFEPLIENWNGTKWSVVPSPTVMSTLPDGLAAVSADSPNDVWAVGSVTPSSVTDTLIEHYNGTSWSVVPSPDPGSPTNVLTGVVAISATDAWAVGYYFPGSPDYLYNTLILHWNGHVWSQVTSPNPSPNTNRLYAVAASSASNIWAVGVQCPVAQSTCPNGNNTLIEHYNGTSWSVVPSPDPSASSTSEYNNVLNAVATDAANDAWAVGYYRNTATGVNQTFTARWTGSQWKTVRSPNPSTTYNTLAGVAELPSGSTAPSTDVWAVGSYTNTSSVLNTLALNWNGTKWAKT